MILLIKVLLNQLNSKLKAVKAILRRNNEEKLVISGVAQKAQQKGLELELV